MFVWMFIIDRKDPWMVSKTYRISVVGSYFMENKKSKIGMTGMIWDIWVM